MKGMGLDSRIGLAFLQPGLGYGGSCFPKDVKAIEHTSREHGSAMEIVAAVERVNAKQKTIMLPRMEKMLGGLKDKKVAVWGIAFKPRTDDIRDAPALALIDAMLAAGAKVRVHDPEAIANVRAIYGDRIVYSDRPYGALEGAVVVSSACSVGEDLRERCWVGEVREVFGNSNRRNVGVDLPELAAHFARRVRLQVPRFQLRRATPHEHQDAGLGLAESRCITELAGGRRARSP